MLTGSNLSVALLATLRELVMSIMCLMLKEVVLITLSLIANNSVFRAVECPADTLDDNTCCPNLQK